MFILDETTEEETSQSEEESEEELSEETQVSEPEAEPEPPKPKKTKPQKKPFERSDSIYLATVRYKSLGLPANQKRLSSSRKKEIEDKLEKNQEKLKSVCLTLFCFQIFLIIIFRYIQTFMQQEISLKRWSIRFGKRKRLKDHLRSPIHHKKILK